MATRSVSTQLKRAVKRGRSYSAPSNPRYINTCPSSLLRALITAHSATTSMVRIRNVTFMGDMDLAHVVWSGTLDLSDCVVRGDINLSHARIDGRISLTRATVETLRIVYVDITGSLYAPRLTAKRGVFALGAQISGSFRLTRAILTAPPDRIQRAALDMYNSSIGDLYLNRATLKGGLYAIGMTVRRNVRLQGADIYSRRKLGWEQGGDAGDGVDLAGSSIGSSLYLTTPKVGKVAVNGGTIRLNHATCRNFMVDSSTLETTNLQIDGFTYISLSPATGYEVLRMLDNQYPTSFAAYSMLKSYAKSMGALSLQRDTAIHLEQRITQRGPHWWTPIGAWRRLLSWSVGYGYRPSRALLWLSVCIAVESVVLHRADGFVTSKSGLPASPSWPAAVTLAIDRLLPFASLDYQSHLILSPSEPSQWWWFMIFVAVKIAAWILAALGIAAVTGIIRKN